MTHVYWHAVDEDGYEPVEGYGRDVHLEVLEGDVKIGTETLNEGAEDALVGLGCNETAVEVLWRKVLLHEEN